MPGSHQAILLTVEQQHPFNMPEALTLQVSSLVPFACLSEVVHYSGVANNGSS